MDQALAFQSVQVREMRREHEMLREVFGEYFRFVAAKVSQTYVSLEGAILI
jgi:hypothetical protein